MGFRKPLEIKLQLTERCNFDCSFCFNRQSLLPYGKSLGKNCLRQGSTQATAEMPAASARKIISEIAGEGIEKVRFTGGEPLLHPSLLPLLSFAKKQGLNVVLNTNASLISGEKAKKVAKYADNVLVSMHSFPPNANVVEAVKALSKQGCFVRAATILSKENIQVLEQFHAMISGLPFAQWVLLRQIPNALNNAPVSSADMRLAVEKIESFNKGRKKKDRFLIENALPFCCFQPERVSQIALGGVHEDGHGSLFVDASAAIKPSYFFDIVLGNALEHRFLDAWKSDFMKRMNALEFIAEICHNCKYVLSCMSGSRFSAFFANKSLYALDPLAKPSEFL